MAIKPKSHSHLPINMLHTTNNDNISIKNLNSEILDTYILQLITLSSCCPYSATIVLSPRRIYSNFV